MVTRITVQQRQRLFREGLGQLIAAEEDLELVGAASASTDLMAICLEQRPDAVLLEADPTDWSAERLVRAIRRALPRVRVVGLSTGDMPAPEIAQARRCGMRIVLPRSAGIAQILAALRAPSPVARAGTGPSATQPPPAVEPVDVRLTARELTILNLVGAGFTSREISSQLVISHKTVENHKQRIFGKLGVQNQAHAVSVAIRRGLLRPERVIGLSRVD